MHAIGYRSSRTAKGARGHMMRALSARAASGGSLYTSTLKTLVIMFGLLRPGTANLDVAPASAAAPETGAVWTAGASEGWHVLHQGSGAEKRMSDTDRSDLNTLLDRLERYIAEPDRLRAKTEDFVASKIGGLFKRLNCAGKRADPRFWRSR